MKTKLHGILTELITLWHEDEFLDIHADYNDRLVALMTQLETIVRPGTNPDVERTEEDAWSELYAKNRVFDWLAEDIKAKSFEGHPPGNDFEGDDK